MDGDHMIDTFGIVQIVTSDFSQARPIQPSPEALSYGNGKAYQVTGTIPSGADITDCEIARGDPGVSRYSSATGGRDCPAERRDCGAEETEEAPEAKAGSIF